MSKAFERIKAGLEDAIEYARGDTKERRVHQIEVPAKFCISGLRRVLDMPIEKGQRTPHCQGELMDRWTFS